MDHLWGSRIETISKACLSTVLWLRASLIMSSVTFDRTSSQDTSTNRSFKRSSRIWTSRKNLSIKGHITLRKKSTFWREKVTCSASTIPITATHNSRGSTEGKTGFQAADTKKRITKLNSSRRSVEMTGIQVIDSWMKRMRPSLKRKNVGRTGIQDIDIKKK